jgi:Ca2+-binding RTX toxin-like protein
LPGSEQIGGTGDDFLVAAADADDRFIYNKGTGNLLYDADGHGAGAAILFVNLGAGTILTHADIMIF